MRCQMLRDTDTQARIGYSACLTLNRVKTKELAITTSPIPKTVLAPPRPDIEHMTSLRILGVVVNDKLTAADHFTSLLSSSSSLLFAMRVLRAHGTPAASLHDVFRATVVSRLQDAAPAWSGMCSAAEWARLDSLQRRCPGHHRSVQLRRQWLFSPCEN